jgi:hypothetical protein
MEHADPSTRECPLKIRPMLGEVVGSYRIPHAGQPIEGSARLNRDVSNF